MMIQTALLLSCLLLASLASEGLGEIHSCGPVMDNNNRLQIGLSLIQCAQIMSDPYQPITHVVDYVEAGYHLEVEAKFEFNNLISVDELENTVSVDFFYRLWWQDIRWNFTQEFWNKVPISVYFDGIELYPYTWEAENPLPYWRPDLHFVDAVAVEEFAGLMKLRPDGQFYWSRHMTATIMQPDLYLKDYPKDEQNVVIIFESYGYTQGVMGLTFRDPPIGYITDKNDEPVFSKNPVWFHHAGDYSTTVYENDYTDNPAFPRIFVALEMALHIERAGRGILVRYALPILILLILSSATFWADAETRIDTTMTILLSVSALYVVIIDGIPQVGYLTRFDKWIFVMYTCVALYVVLHQIVIVLRRKTTAVPLRGCAIRTIEFLGRVFSGPLSVLYYMFTFMDPSPTLLALFIFVLLCFSTFVTLREWGGLKKSFVDASDSICAKVEKEQKVTSRELFFMNFVSYGRISASDKHFKSRLARSKRRSEDNQKSAIEMKRKSFVYDSDDDED